MRRLIYPLASFCIACSDGGSLYRDALPVAENLSSMESVWSHDSLVLNGGQGRFDFVVAEGSQSFLVVVSGLSGAEYLISSLSGPDGVLVRAEANEAEAASGFGAAAGPFFSPNRSVGDHGGATLLVPNDPLLRLTPGRWELGVTSSSVEQHELRVDRLELHAAGLPLRSVIPLTIHLSGAEGMTGALGRGHERLDRALQKVEQVYEPAGLAFEPITFVDLAPEFRVLDAVDLRSQKALQMLGRGVGRAGINLFIIERFENDEALLGDVGGVSAAIPGDPRGGEPLSGVVVATSFSEDAAARDLLGLTMAHEIGHFLGLFHSEEANGFEDNLSDTLASEGSNLMHHLSRPGFDALSAEQGMVLRLNPAMQLP
jgi:hypothetical protein